MSDMTLPSAWHAVRHCAFRAMAPVNRCKPLNEEEKNACAGDCRAGRRGRALLKMNEDEQN
ncbi:hypothetical protein [Stutzerimonas azotifigens]|uniref:hypothetical protein n=1 Tax=Stutzerimonas azotifigens TaxID=291995 RepID=UPI001268E6C0|nr:hypothetical protein [Stutzerimonas azotifigens]